MTGCVSGEGEVCRWTWLLVWVCVDWMWVRTGVGEKIGGGGGGRGLYEGVV